jgi:hypothetical protein
MFRRYLTLSAGVLALLCGAGMPGQLHAQRTTNALRTGARPQVGRIRTSFDRAFFGPRFDRVSPSFGPPFIGPRFGGFGSGFGPAFIDPRFSGFRTGFNPQFIGPGFGTSNFVPVPVPVPVPVRGG